MILLVNMYYSTTTSLVVVVLFKVSVFTVMKENMQLQYILSVVINKQKVPLSGLLVS